MAEELEELVDSLAAVYAAISSNTAITRRPPKPNVMGTERQDSITRENPWLGVTGSNDNSS